MESSVFLEKVRLLQKDPTRIRNFCILAHVDHGKTCLSDCLISANNIISKAMAGKLRYLDSLPAEREREITMKSSCISILFKNQVEDKEYLVNLMDSPGHVDFSFEVSAALRLADNALIVVDALEGVSPQTITVIRQAWEEKVKACLVINKVDRLFIEKFMTPAEVYEHLQRILEEINVQMASQFRENLESQEYAQRRGKRELTKQEEEQRELEEQKLLFSPEKGNVAFTSAMDGWGFTLREMAELLGKKRGFKPRVIQKYLWGNYYFNAKTNAISTKPPSVSHQPLAISFILDPIYREYQKFFPEGLQEKGSELKQARMDIKAILSKRLPIDRSLLRMIITHLNSPIQAQPLKLKVLNPRLGNPKLLKQLRANEKLLKDAIQGVDPTGPTSIYISKMFKYDPKLLNNSVGHKFVGFARVMSGVLKSGDQMYARGPTFSQKKSLEPPTPCVVKHLYVQMGQQLERVDQVAAGNIVALGDLDDIILKTGSLFSRPDLPPFSPMSFMSQPILRVAVEPVDLADMPKMQAGLRKLNKADPCVEVYVDNHSGEHIIAACGEVHMQRCIQDLSQEYAGCEIHQSEPMFSFRETVFQKNIKRVKAKVAEKQKKKEIEVIEKSKKRLQRKEKLEGEEDKGEIIKPEEVTDTPATEEGSAIIEEDKKQEEYVKMARENEWSGFTDPEDDGLEDSSQQEQKKSQESEISDQDGDSIISSQPSQDPSEAQSYKQIGPTEQAQMSSALLSDTKNLYIEKWQKVRDNSDVNTGFAEDTTQNGVCRFAVRVVALPLPLLRYIESEESTIRALQDYVEQDRIISSKEPLRAKARGFLAKWEALVQEAEGTYPRRVCVMLRKHVLGFGPRRCGGNVIVSTHIDERDAFMYKVKRACGQVKKEAPPPKQSVLFTPINTDLAQKYTTPKDMKTSMFAGFQLATMSGPLVEQEMLGVLFMVEKVEFLDFGGGADQTLEGKALQDPALALTPTKIKEKLEDQENGKEEEGGNQQEIKVSLDDALSYTSSNSKSTSVSKARHKPPTSSTLTPSISVKASPATGVHHGLFSGQIMSTLKHLCRRAFMAAQPRLMEAMFLCTLRVDTDTMGQIYSLVSKYRGKVESEECEFESQIFSLRALIPVVESFKFTDQLSNKSAGIAYPQMTFSNWESLEEDPFYVTSSQDDIEDFGNVIQPPNLPKRLIHALRKRKGLPLEGTLVAQADKQRTMGKMK